MPHGGLCQGAAEPEAAADQTNLQPGGASLRIASAGIAENSLCYHTCCSVCAKIGKFKAALRPAVLVFHDHRGGGITGILKVMGDFYLGHKVPFHFCIVIESIAKGFWRNPLLTLADAAAEEIGLGRRRDPAPVLRRSDQAFV